MDSADKMLFEAVKEGNIIKLEGSIESGGDPNISFEKIHALQLIMNRDEESSKQLEILELLLSSGANPNNREFNGNYPLYTAVEKGWESSAKLLVKYGADSQVRRGLPVLSFIKTGMSPMVLAEKLGKTSMVEIMSSIE